MSRPDPALFTASLLVSCPDQPGLVAALAQLLYVVLPIPVQENDPDFLSTLALAMGVVAFAEAIGTLALLRIRALGPISAGTLNPQSREGVAGLFTTLIICWVLAESIAVYGLVLRVMGAESDVWSPFAVVGGLLLLRFFHPPFFSSWFGFSF